MPGSVEADVNVSGYEVQNDELVYPGESWRMSERKKSGSHVYADGTQLRTRYIVRAVERPDVFRGGAQVQRPRHEFVITEILPNGSSKDLFRSCDIEDLTDIISTARVPVECEGELIKKLLDGFTTTEIAEHVFGEI